jgi:predicted HNH restriction endonuclease
MQNMNDYEKFQSLLAWFVRQLMINNDLISGEHISGQGKDGQRIRDNYIDWRNYSIGEIDISMQTGFASASLANYIHWTMTWVNIVAVPDSIGIDTSIFRLRIINKKDNVERTEYASKTAQQLGVSSFPPQNEPNSDLKNFFDTFKQALFDYEDDAFRSPEEIATTKGLVEGAKRLVTINAYERNANARRKCIEKYGAKCRICGIDLGEKYGAELNGKIVVHHITPLSKINEQYTIDPINDLIPVCPNCHFALHSKNDGVFTPAEVSAMIRI